MSYYAIVMTETRDALQHHGILGMKWGIRRFQNPDGTLTRKGKERYSGHKDDLVYKKGTEFEHLSLNKNLKLSEDKTYLSSEDWDKYVYKGVFALEKMQNNKTNLSYLYTYVNDVDLVSPSEKNRINLFIDTYKDNPVKYGEYLKSLDKELDNLKNTSNDELGKHLDETEFKPKDVSKASDKDLKKAYRMFTSASGYKDHSNDDMIKAYYEKVKQKGYNSIIDDNDSGNYYFVTNPIISLNSSKTLKEISKEKWDTETAKAYADAVNDELSYYLQYL